jgi:speckle-type POZ protein
MSSISENDNEHFIKQWVSEVIEFSSEYDNVNQFTTFNLFLNFKNQLFINTNLKVNWSAVQIIGQPKVYPEYGDRHGAWAQRDRDSQQFIVVKFAQSIYLTALNIYETYHAGGIVRIKARNNEADQWVTVWESPNQQPEVVQQSRIFSPILEKITFKTDAIRLDVDCSLANSWCEIDAIEMIGKHFLTDSVQTDETLSCNLLKLLESEEFSDIKFEVQGKIINGHRNIFAARSIYFKNIICETTNLDPKCSKPVHIENITYDVFKALMFYLYSGTIDSYCNGETVCELIRASKWYDLEGLDQVGYMFIKKMLCHENVIGILVNSTKKEPHLNRVEKQCLKYFAKNFNEVLTNPEFKSLEKSILVKITQFYGQFFQKHT